MSEFRRRLMMAQGGGVIRNDDYLNFKALEASTINMTSSLVTQPTLYYSMDLETWNAFNSNTTVTLNAGELVYFKGANNALATATNRYTTFSATGKLSAHGNIMSLLYGDDVEGKLTVPSYAFYRLFRGCAPLTTAPDLPATTLALCCYNGMFTNCTNIEEAPTLPATALTDQCYRYLFQGCSKLKYVKMLALAITGSYPCQSWLYQVPNVNTSVFVKHINASWTTTGNDGVPNKWKIIYYDPALDKYYTDQTRATECDDHGNPI